MSVQNARTLNARGSLLLLMKGVNRDCFVRAVVFYLFVGKWSAVDLHYNIVKGLY